MPIGLQIFLKVLLYSIIIIAVRGVIGKIQKPPKEITVTELGERFIDWKIYSIIYLVIAIGFTIIFVLAVSLPSNLEGIAKGIVIGIFALIILFFCLMSFLYVRVYVKIGKDKIHWRKMTGKEHEVRYEDITSYEMDGLGNLKLYQDEKCILAFATGIHKVFATEVLKKHKVAAKNNGSKTLIIKQGKGYVIFDASAVIVLIIFFLMSAYYGVISGVFVFFLCIVGSIFEFFSRKARKIIVENCSIVENRMLKKQKRIEFGQVAYLTLINKNNTEVICIHSHTGTKIEVPKHYQNVGVFEEIIAKQRWRWK